MKQTEDETAYNGLIGNLLDRWEMMPNDLQQLIHEQDSNFYDAMTKAYQLLPQAIKLNQLASYKQELREKIDARITILNNAETKALHRNMPFLAENLEWQSAGLKEALSFLEDKPNQSKCSVCGKPKRMDGKGTIELLCEC